MLRFLALRTVRGRFRLFSMLLIALPVLTAVLLFGLVIQTRVEDQERRRLARTVAQQATVIEAWLDRQMGDIRFLAATRSARLGDLEHLGMVLEAFDESHADFAGLAYAGPDGRVVESTGEPSGVDIADRAYFQAARRGQSFISDVLTSRSSGADEVIFAAPVLGRDRSFRGVILGAVRTSFLNDYLILLETPADTRIVVANSAGQVFVGGLRPHGSGDPAREGEPLRALPPVYAQALRGGSLPSRYTNYQGERVIGASRLVKDGQWAIFAETPRRVALSTELAFLGLVALGGLGVIVILTPALIGLARSIERPLEEMARAAGEIEAGHFEVNCREGAVRGSPEEIRRLYDSFCHMAARLRDMVAQLEETSSTDALTGLPNRRSLFGEGLRLAGACLRGGGPCAVLMIDLDHFKQINDSHGHAAGDRALAHVAGLIRSAARASDLVARYGGEEFVVLAPNAGPREARVLAERIRTRVAAEACPLPSGGFSCTVSIGAAALEAGGNDAQRAFEEALQRADQALYRAKDQGRNRVEGTD